MASGSRGGHVDAFDAVNQAMTDFEGGSDGDGQPFLPASKFSGAKYGYYYSSGPQGVGYVNYPFQENT